MSMSKSGFFRKFWDFLKKPSAKYSVFAIACTCFVGGILFSGGFHVAMDHTNTLEFCISCHAKGDTVYQEYKETIHYSNRTGVRATCADCHVPKDFAHKMIAKVGAAKDVWGSLTGTIDTPEKFEAKRMEMATHQWQIMKDSNSRECRSCHNFDAMSPDYQKPAQYKRHMKAKEDGKTCIDCHKGIAHQLPKEYEDPDE